MGSFKFNGVDGITASFEQLAKLDDDTRWRIISAGAEVVKRFQKAQIDLVFQRRTGQLFGSITVKKKKSGEDMVAQIAPTGKRKRGSTVPGIKGSVDTNEAYKDYARNIRDAGLNRLHRETPGASSEAIFRCPPRSNLKSKEVKLLFCC